MSIIDRQKNSFTIQVAQPCHLAPKHAIRICMAYYVDKHVKVSSIRSFRACVHANFPPAMSGRPDHCLYPDHNIMINCTEYDTTIVKLSTQHGPSHTDLSLITLTAILEGESHPRPGGKGGGGGY